MIMDLREERIVVTGGEGFLGRHVLKEMRNQGVESSKLLIPRMEEYDLTKDSDVQRMYDDMQPSVIVHLAAEVGGIGANRENPGRFFYSNALMGIHLIEHARIRMIKKFVQIGTICAYPRDTPVPFREEHLWDGYPEETNAPYGIAKKALLVMLQAYRSQYGLNGIYLLPVNLYGPWDNFDLSRGHVIPALIRKFTEARESGAQEVVLWGTGEASREFLFVEDAAQGIVMATERYEDSDPINLGVGVEITIMELAGKVKAMTGFDGRIVWDPGQPNGQPRRSLDTSRALAEFGFRARTGIDEGLKRTIEWYRVHGVRVAH